MRTSRCHRHTKPIGSLVTGCLLALAFPSWSWGQAVEAPSTSGPATAIVQSLGPVHEALVPASSLPVDEITRVTRRPPQESPQLSRPPQTSSDAKWIEGYWHWQRGRSEFVWVPGVWRKVPPGMEWQPGKWLDAPTGAVHYPGYWFTAGKRPDVLRQPPPEEPEFLEDRGRQATPGMIGSDAFWVRGGWELDAQQRYRWRSGYLAAEEPGYHWHPARVVPVSGGYVVLAGFWDYPLDERGTGYAALRQPISQSNQLVPVDMLTLALAYDGNWRYTQLAGQAATTTVAIRTQLRPEIGPRQLPRGPAFDGRATIEGIVRKGKLTPQYIEIKLMGGAALLTETNADGRFRFENIPYGVYTLFAEGPVQNYMRYGSAIVSVEQPAVRVEIELE